MIWDLIRDWFVVYVWGGYASNEYLYGGFVGRIISGDTEMSATTRHYMVNIGRGGLNFGDGYAVYEYNYITLGDWLSTTSTIITLIILVTVFFLFIRYLYRLTAGLIRVH